MKATLVKTVLTTYVITCAAKLFLAKSHSQALPNGPCPPKNGLALNIFAKFCRIFH